MATQIAELKVAESIPQPPRVKAATRLVSLDAYRGFIMLMLASTGFGLSVLASYPRWSWLAYQVDHTAWEGCTFWDLIQPAFTFMVGVAMPFSLARRLAKGDNTWGLFRHVLVRAFLLILLSNIYSNWGSSRPRAHLTFQLINVLSQMAIGYVLCFLITRLRFWPQVAIAAAMLAGHWALFAIFPGPQGAFSQTGNIGQVIDLKLLGYNYSGYYTTLNCIGNAVTILFGCWAGMLLQTDKSHAYKLKVLLGCAAAGFALGLALQPFNPMVKRLWTASFTLFSHTNCSWRRASSGISSSSFSLRAGSITVEMPARSAASTFSLMPPTGSTRPRRLISPVIATLLGTGVPIASEASAMNMATPALGPSLGMAPAGTCTWISQRRNTSEPRPSAVP